jgi:predicted TIM-barrel fold metal-dependent hydrolase
MTTSGIVIPKIVSIDDHVNEPPELWQNRLPSKFREIGPRVVREKVPYVNTDGYAGEAWGDVWRYEDVKVETKLYHVAADVPPSEIDMRPITYDDMQTACYDPAERLAVMDRDGVAASLCFPQFFVRFCGQRFNEAKDKDLALRCVRAYNDWLHEEWEGGSGGRLYGATIIPLWDANLAAAEVRRNAARGARAVTFSELPTRLGLPSMYSGAWEPFFEACAETDTLICIHIGSSSTNLTSSDDAPIGVINVNHYAFVSLSLTDWILSGVFVRHPRLRVMYSEGQAGWIPYLLGRLDVKWREGYGSLDGVRKLVPELPSSYFKDHVFACVTQDPAASMFIDTVGVDNICFETDYPHPDSSFPNSVEVARQQFAGLNQEQVNKVVHDNGRRLLDPSYKRTRALETAAIL